MSSLSIKIKDFFFFLSCHSGPELCISDPYQIACCSSLPTNHTPQTEKKNQFLQNLITSAPQTWSSSLVHRSHTCTQDKTERFTPDNFSSFTMKHHRSNLPNYSQLFSSLSQLPFTLSGQALSISALNPCTSFLTSLPFLLLSLLIYSVSPQQSANLIVSQLSTELARSGPHFL